MGGCGMRINALICTVGFVMYPLALTSVLSDTRSVMLSV